MFAGGLNLAVDNKAKNLLEIRFRKDIEFLPMNIIDEKEKWFLINITHLVNSTLSLENSKFKIRSNGTFGRLTKAVFDLKKIPNDRPFVYPQWINAFMFKGESLKALIEENQLRGLCFERYDAV